MPGVVTPSRRSREDDETEGEEEFDVSVDGEGTPRSSVSKRARLDEDEESGDEEPEAAEGEVLPDSFRRSPKGMGNGLANGHVNGDGPKKHQPGSIVRVTLTNFVTYTKAEFHPGPSLNMIIGPNGTGKSTLVCAICLGLGWSTSHLGRAKDLGEFVKHGAPWATIEIELAADPARHIQNPVITTKITKEGNKAEYSITGKKSNKKGVQELARSFSIQVDNLCQFLPQDRVVEFAALSPIDLLTQTQRAAAPECMSEWHDQLKSMRKEQKQKQTEQQSTLETLKQMENRQRLQEPDVVRLRERSDLQARIATYEKLRPFSAYREVKNKHLAAKTRKAEAQKELKHLERKMAPNLQAVNEKAQYLAQIDRVVASRKRLVERSEGTVTEIGRKIDGVKEKISECDKELDAETNSTKTVRQSIPRLRQDIAQIQRARQTPPEQFDPAQMNAQIREKQRRINDIEARGREIREEFDSLTQQVRQRQQIIADAEKEKENLRSQVGQQVNKLRQASNDSAKAWAWIQSNRDRFQGPVFGPPVVECTLKDPSHANAVESMVKEGEKLAFTVTSEQDFKMLQQQLYGAMKLSHIYIRSSSKPLSDYQAPVSTEQLQQHGLESWILDLIEGPEPVLAMLCDNSFIHQTGFVSRDISDAEHKTLERSAISSWVTPKNSYHISRRREYGDKATSTRVQAVREAQFFTDAPVDHQMEQNINARIRNVTGEMEELKRSIDELKGQGEQLKEERKQLNEERKAIDEEKATKQRRLVEFQGLAAKEDRLQGKLNAAEEEVRGSTQRKRAIDEKCDKLYMDKGQLAIDYANSVEQLKAQHLLLFEAEIPQIEGKSDLEQLRAQHAEEERLLEERRGEVAELQQEQDRLLEAGRNLREECRAIGNALTDFETVLHEQTDEEWWLPDRLQTELESVQAQLEMTHVGGSENLLREFEKRAKSIEEKHARLRELDSGLEDLESQITEVREQWEPMLDGLVGKISRAFAENFEKIQCAGEVSVHKDEDFELWAIQIKVKFRENEALSILDSHRQSGGERAVSTIFYLMALQSLARAPFRVVDEINQGMDPRNERLVHSRMVDIACEENTSQYFLITPKLLSGLKYHQSMMVHCIASGEHMPSDWRELDFGTMAKRALEVRGRAVAAG